MREYMALDTKKYPLLYSIGTNLAYMIAKKHYGNIHYAWCTTEFSSIYQPPTSNPSKICQRYLDVISKGDRHAVEINNNIAGILKGAKAKLDSNVISKQQFKIIRYEVANAWYEDFFPMLYIIQSEKVKHKCIEVPMPNRASDDAVEYLIDDLRTDEFDAIFFRNILSGILVAVDKEVGYRW